MRRYVFSTDVARALVETNAIAPLKFMPNEDATFGFWVMGMNLRRVDHPRAKTAAGHCCYKCDLLMSTTCMDSFGSTRAKNVRASCVCVKHKGST